MKLQDRLAQLDTASMTSAEIARFLALFLVMIKKEMNISQVALLIKKRQFTLLKDLLN